jgi:hypothetical protein
MPVGSHGFNDTPNPQPGIAFLQLTELLRKVVLPNASQYRKIAAWLLLPDHHPVLALLEEHWPEALVELPRERSARAMHLAASLVRSMQALCDELHRPDGLFADPYTLLRCRFTVEPIDYKVRFWTCAHLHWFNGRSLDDTADHLAIPSIDKVKRSLDATAEELDALWRARYLPNLP